MFAFNRINLTGIVNSVPQTTEKDGKKAVYFWLETSFTFLSSVNGYKEVRNQTFRVILRNKNADQAYELMNTPERLFNLGAEIYVEGYLDILVDEFGKNPVLDANCDLFIIQAYAPFSEIMPLTDGYPLPPDPTIDPKVGLP